MALGADESFATVAEADTYGAARGWTDWAALTTAAKEAALRDGTGFIVSTCSFPGAIESDAQVLPVPRTGWTDRENRTLTGTPTALKNATIEAARLTLTGPLIGGDTSGEPQLARRKTGQIEREWFQTSEGQKQAARAKHVLALLSILRVTQSFGGSTANIVRA